MAIVKVFIMRLVEADGVPSLAGEGSRRGSRIGRLFKGGDCKVEMMRLLTTALALVVIAARLVAQAPATGPADLRFEVASVKPSAPDNSAFDCVPPMCSASTYQTLPGRFKASKMSALALVSFAYSVPENRIVGPAWAESERFDVDAKNASLFPRSSGGTGPLDQSALNSMLQHLLEDRFALRLRREMRPMDVYILMKARDDGRLGPQLVRSSAPVDAKQCGGGSTFLPEWISCGRLNLPSLTTRMARGKWEDVGLAQAFFSSVDRPVFDETMLTGWFEMKLEWSDDPSQVEKPSLYTALRQQLGLKLESAKRSMEFLIIENVERPKPD